MSGTIPRIGPKLGLHLENLLNDHPNNHNFSKRYTTPAARMANLKLFLLDSGLRPL